MSGKFPGFDIPSPDRYDNRTSSMKVESKEEEIDNDILINNEFLENLETSNLDMLMSTKIIQLLKASKEIRYIFNTKLMKRLEEDSKKQWEVDKLNLDPMLDPDNLPKVHALSKYKVKHDPNVLTFSKLIDTIDRNIKLMTTVLS